VGRAREGGGLDQEEEEECFVRRWRIQGHRFVQNSRDNLNDEREGMRGMVMMLMNYCSRRCRSG
jgi:hypothetical protein